LASAGGDETVAIQYHFAGAADLSANTNFALAGKLLSLPSSVAFRNLVLDRLAGVYWRGLQFKADGKPVASLRPLLEDLLSVESAASFGGTGKDHLDFVLAARLNKARTQAWQQSLEAALGGKGEGFVAEGFPGTRWNRPGDRGLWLVQASGWLVAGQGEDLAAVRADYLQQIHKNGRPRPALRESWLKADIDWPRLSAWVPLESSPFKLARTSVDATSGQGRFRLTGFVTYPEAPAWQAAPWKFPRDLVREPLCSFTAARDVGPFLKADAALARLFGRSIAGQFCCWAQAQMPFQSYAAWPSPGGAGANRKLLVNSMPDLNALLTLPSQPKVIWSPKTTEIIWPRGSLITPSISATNGPEGDYMLAKLFPLTDTATPAPAGLWAQFEGRDDLVYYDWEFTGPRLQQWRLLCELLPVLPPVSAAPAAPAPGSAARPPLFIVDDWLAGLTPYLNNTVTEIKRTSSNELSLTRSTPFVLNSFELLWLSHWLTDTPAGPVNVNQLPMAKMSGPGMPSR
jgi:hypothetical protein